MELIAQSARLTCPSSHALNSTVRFVDFSRTVLAKRLQFSTPPYKLRSMEAQRTVSCASVAGVNGSPVTIITETAVGRIGEVERVTKETNVYVKLNLDGSGIADSSTSIPFLDHMLDQLASHGLFDVHVKASGDTHIDDHHTNEDVALAIGTSLLRALGDRKGINRFGDFSAPLDEALIHVSLDLSGRPHLSYDLQIPTERVGKYDTQLVEHFFQSLVNTSGMTLHIRQLAGKNSHHIIEATFKAFARALRQATEYDPRRLGSIPRSVWSILVEIPDKVVSLLIPLSFQCKTSSWKTLLILKRGFITFLDHLVTWRSTQSLRRRLSFPNKVRTNYKSRLISDLVSEYFLRGLDDSR